MNLNKIYKSCSKFVIICIMMCELEIFSRLVDANSRRVITPTTYADLASSLLLLPKTCEELAGISRRSSERSTDLTFKALERYIQTAVFKPQHPNSGSQSLKHKLSKLEIRNAQQRMWN